MATSTSKLGANREQSESQVQARSATQAATNQGPGSSKLSHVNIDSQVKTDSQGKPRLSNQT